MELPDNHNRLGRAAEVLVDEETYSGRFDPLVASAYSSNSNGKAAFEAGVRRCDLGERFSYGQLFVLIFFDVEEEQSV